MFHKINTRCVPLRFSSASCRASLVRAFSVQEHVAQSILSKRGINVPRGEVARTPQETASAVDRLGSSAVLKAQILAGGRGKGVFSNGLKGGVHKVGSIREAENLAQEMLGHRLRTNQTSKSGLPVEKLYVTEKVEYENEFYLSLAIDRMACKVALVVSRTGGMDIEKAAENDPSSVTKIHLPYDQDITREEAASVAKVLNLASDKSVEEMRDFISRLYSLFKSTDATMLEINPLVVTKSGSLICLDSKFSFDDAARNRQPELFELKEDKDADSRQALAEKHGFAYLSLDGAIGNIANGAGLAMATMDAIAHYGGTCANFLDAGGKATKETMVNALQLVLSDDRVKVLFLNIYGGLIRGEMVADAFLNAINEIGPVDIPMVVRLEGTNSEEGRKMLENGNLGIHSIRDFSEAVQKAVELSKE